MKKMMLLLLTCSMLLAGGCAKKNEAPQLHTIPYPENYETNQDMDGADAFGNWLDAPDGTFYAVNDFYNMKSGGTLHILENFETYQQTTEYTCGNASSLMVLNHFGVDGYDEMQLAELMKTDTTHGTTVEGIRDFFTDLGWEVDAHAGTDFRFETPEELAEYVTEHIDAGTPIMVDWVDWAGHWQVVIGIDTGNPESVYDDVLILADPYDITDRYQDGYYTFPLGRFMGMWYEGPCTANEERYQQPFVTAVPKN